MTKKNTRDFEEYIQKLMNEESNRGKSTDTTDIKPVYLDVIPPITFIKDMGENGQFHILLGLMNQRENEEDQ